VTAAARGSASGAPRRSSGNGSEFDFECAREEEIQRGHRGGGDLEGAGGQVRPATTHIRWRLGLLCTGVAGGCASRGGCLFWVVRLGIGVWGSWRWPR
jgi:hypothetical protein